MPHATARTTRTRTLLAALTAACALVVLLVPGGPAQAVAAQPRTPAFPAQIEPYPRYERETECDPVAKPGAVDLVAIIKATYGSAEVANIPRACTGTGSSGHHSGRAVDWMANARVATQRQKGDAFVAWLLATDSYGNRHAMARRLGINYIIWNSKKLYLFDVAAGWTEYQDCVRVRTSAADDNYCHRNHVHVSMLWTGARMQTSWWTGGAGLPLTPRVADLGAVSTGPTDGLVTSPDVDASVLVRQWDEAGGPSGRVDVGGATFSAPAIVQWPDGRTEVVVVGTNGTLYLAARPAGAAWSGWTRIGGAALRGRPAALSRPDGTLLVFAPGTDGTLWQTWRSPDGTWAPWLSLGGAIPAGAGVAAATAADGSIRVAVRGTDSQAWVRSWTSSAGWSRRWTGIGGIIVADPAAVADPATGGFSVVARGTNDIAYVTDLQGTGAGRWANLGGVLVGAPAAAAVAGEGIEVIFTGSDGRTYRKLRQEGRWSGWTAIG